MKAAIKSFQKAKVGELKCLGPAQRLLKHTIINKLEGPIIQKGNKWTRLKQYD